MMGSHSQQDRFEIAREAAEDARRRFEDHDPQTFQHSVRVAHWSMLLARTVPGFSQARLRRLEITALLHDFGKTFIDPAVIRKAGPLNESEWQLMRQHPVLGAERPPVSGEYVEPNGIRWHHKHYDGNGYPEGDISGLELPLEARLIAVADVFDALTSHREYRATKKIFSPAEAMGILRDVAGSQLDASLVALFDMLYKNECVRVGGMAGAKTLQVMSVIGTEIQRARDLLRRIIGPFDTSDPLKGSLPQPGLIDKLISDLVGANLDGRSAENIARYVLRLSLRETFNTSDMIDSPKHETTSLGDLAHHTEIILKLRRMPPDVSYMRVVVFLGQLWLSIGEQQSGNIEIRLAR